MIKTIIFLFSLVLILQITSFSQIVHDAEYYVIEAQNGERWKADDKEIETKLAGIRNENGGKPPNIVFILLDDDESGSSPPAVIVFFI